MQKGKIFTMLFLFLVSLALPNRTFSQTDSAVKTLKGFDTLKIEVEPLAADLEKSGITKEQIQTDVETKLRRARFKIKSAGETIAPYIALYVSVNSIDNGVGGFAVSITTRLNQFVVLDRDKSVTTAAGTWETRSIVSVIKEKVQAIRNFVNVQTDLFIKDYLKANTSTTMPAPTK